VLLEGHPEAIKAYETRQVRVKQLKRGRYVKRRAVREQAELKELVNSTRGDIVV
jgi:hypothetical protein